MEVYSSRKPVNQRVTLATTGALTLIAVLQSVSMVDQKWKRWDTLLGSATSIDPLFRVRTPQDWQPARKGNTDWIVLAGELDSPPNPYELWIQRIPQAELFSREQIYDYVFSHLGIHSPTLPLEPVECELGGFPASMVGIEFSGPGGRPEVARLIAEPDTPGGMTLLMLRTSGGPDETVRGLLRHIAATAEFGDRPKSQ